MNEQMKTALRLLIDGYPLQTFPEGTQRFYVEMLQDIPADRLVWSVKKAIREAGDFRPSASAICKAADKYYVGAYSDPNSRFWYRMGELGRVLRGERVNPPELPQGVTTELDHLTPEELERLADEKAGYLVPEPF